MDFKGIKWAGNIYQKFETMCLEVEEVMYEDTVKYVENQVQKVGASVKKFYSEVMQDIDPVKVAAGDLSLNPYAHTDINKKPKLEGWKEFKKKDTRDDEFTDPTAEKESLLTDHTNHLSPLSSRVFVENTNSELCSTKSKKLGIQKRPIGIKRISQNSRPSKVSSQGASLSGEKSIQLKKPSFVARHNPAEAVWEITPTPMPDAPVEFAASDQKLSAESVRETKDDSVSTSDKITSAERETQKIDKSECTPPASDKKLPVESVRANNEDFERASPAAEKILSAESIRIKKDDIECTSSDHSVPSEYIGTPINSIPFSQSGSSVSNTNEVESRGKEVLAPNEGTYASFSQLNTWDIDSAGEEFSMFYEDNFDIEVIDNKEVECFEPVKRSALEETCVLVEGDELHSFQGIEKQKSYKKKLRNALSSKLRLTKKQDQPVSQFKDMEGEISAGPTTPSPSLKTDSREIKEIKAQARDSFESEWELL